jgi:Domain of unknown function (DUF1905)/Bacteriocin-protection, YdeI or OmpD-Associated
MKFTAPLVLNGKTATGIEVPAKIVDALGAGKKPPVRVTLNGHTYRSTVASRGRRYLIGVSAENREAAGVSAGETLTVDIEVDREPREVPLPPELADALANHPVAKAAFHALSPSKKQQLTLPIERAKTSETRQRNVAKALDGLRRSPRA